MRLHYLLAFSICALLLCCGGQFAADGGLDGADGSNDDVVADAGFTQCASPGGDTLCGSTCGPCADACVFDKPIPYYDAADTDVLQLCHVTKAGGGCSYSQDGELCVREDSLPVPVTDLTQVLGYYACFMPIAPPTTPRHYPLHRRPVLTSPISRSAAVRAEPALRRRPRRFNISAWVGLRFTRTAFV